MLCETILKVCTFKFQIWTSGENDMVHTNSSYSDQIVVLVSEGRIRHITKLQMRPFDTKVTQCRPGQAH